MKRKYTSSVMAQSDTAGTCPTELVNKVLGSAACGGTMIDNSLAASDADTTQRATVARTYSAKKPY